MSNNFILDPRKQQEIITQPIWEHLIKQSFPKVKQVDFEVPLELDKNFAIDVQCVFENGMVLYGQVKSLSYNYRERASVTIEYMNDLQSGLCGDWFHMGSQFYACGYCTQEIDDIIREVREARLDTEEEIRECAKSCGIQRLIEQAQGLRPWVILSWFDIVLGTQKGEIQWWHNRNQKRGLADFKYVAMHDILHYCVATNLDLDNVKAQQIITDPLRPAPPVWSIDTNEKRLTFLERNLIEILGRLPRKRQKKKQSPEEQIEIGYLT